MAGSTKIYLFIYIKIYLIINKINAYIERNNGNQYLTLVPADEGKDTLKNYQELWNKIKYLIRSITNNSNNFDEKYMKIKFNSDDELLERKH